MCLWFDAGGVIIFLIHAGLFQARTSRSLPPLCLRRRRLTLRPAAGWAQWQRVQVKFVEAVFPRHRYLGP
jgi:hypothetical protein